MFELFSQYDTQLFIFINHLGHNIILDTFFAFFTGVGYFGIVWFAIAILLYILKILKDKKELMTLFLAGLITFLFVDIGLKHMMKRPRPELSIPAAIVVFDNAHSYSFPSGHATIAFAAAYILGRQHKKLKWFYYLLAVLISYSRIYLGKHYPGDVLFGAVLGLLIGKLSLIVTNWSVKKPTSTHEVGIEN